MFTSATISKHLQASRSAAGFKASGVIENASVGNDITKVGWGSGGSLGGLFSLDATLSASLSGSKKKGTQKTFGSL